MLNCCHKITVMLAIFRKFLVLSICCLNVCFGQVADNVAIIELGSSSFSLERPFTISVVTANSDTRPSLTFPDIPGFTKKGVLTTVRSPVGNEKVVSRQVITQNYQAQAAGRFVLAPFTIVVDGEVVRSEGAVLVVRSSAVMSTTATAVANAPPPPPAGAAFLALRTSKRAVYTGEGVALTLSFFVADSYPYILDFTALDRQLQAIVKKIRPANTWEENRPITELKPVPVVVGGRKYREIPLYQSVFYPLTARPLLLPAVTLRLSRPRPVIGPPSAEVETVAFNSKSVVVAVRALPPHPLRGRVAVGSFRLNEQLERQRVNVGESVRYRFTIEGEGNIAALPAPILPPATAEVDLFPPQEQHTADNTGIQVSGRKTYTYFVVPRQTGMIALGNQFQWIYFDPQRARYDTLRSRLVLQAGGGSPATVAEMSVSDVSGLPGDTVLAPVSSRSLYAGIDALDSTHQPVSIPVLVRAVANVLIVLMLLGMIFVFFKK